MFGTIFKFEFKRWFTNFPFYIYFVVFFALSFMTMASVAGYFDGFKASTASNKFINSPLMINGITSSLSQLIYFIIPTIIGATVYRDFKYNTHQFFYSFPFSKSAYLLAKFFSGFFVTAIITFSVYLAFFIATILPFANQDLLGPINIWAYLQSFLFFVLPNIFVIGVMVYLLVTLTRNVYIGFIFIIVLFILNSIISQLSMNVEDKYWISLFEPTGLEALTYVTKYWSVEQQNYNNIPWDGVILYNRLIWIGISVLLFVVLYFSFRFSHAPINFGRKAKSERIIKNNFGSIIRINLPKVTLDYSLLNKFRIAWKISNLEFLLVVKNWIFITILGVMLLSLGSAGLMLGQELYGTSTYPVTWKVLGILGGVFGFFITIMIYLFSGYLLQLGANSRMNNLIDSTAIPNWVLMFSKVLALLKMTITILFIGMISCIIIQICYGYYNFEILHYIKELFGFELISYIVVILFSLFIQNFFKNYLVGFIVIIVSQIALGYVSKFGLEHMVYNFDSSTGYSYSDMNGYGSVREFFYYRLYWTLCAIFMYCVALQFFRRGIVSGVKERLKLASSRFKSGLWLPTVLSLLAFISLGYAIYYHDTKLEPYYTSQESELLRVDYEKKYKKFQDKAQPRIVDVKVDMDIFPKERNYQANVNYIMVNKSTETIDSIFLNYSDNMKSVTFEQSNKLVLKDTVMGLNIYKLDKNLLPGDTLIVKFEVQNKANTWLTDKSPVIENGTFINNFMFPSFGYSEESEIEHNDIRKKYGLPAKERMAEADDIHARANTYISDNADWITFETTVSTSSDQIAIAPGYLQKEWSEGDRRYFHYKMDQKMLNFYAFNSARYEVKRDQWNDVNLEIYYHKDHTYNLDRMMESIKLSLAYYSENFSPYQHKQVRIIEFPSVMGTFAQSFANTIPFSEAIGFIAKVDEDNPDAVDYPFSVISHEVAHQWWAHQVIGANVKGATLMSESLSEYSSLKVLEHKYGKFQMRKFLKDALDHYLNGRRFEWKGENPLMFNENQQYIHYNKGSLVLYAMSDFIGEKPFNAMLKQYINDVAFQEAPYTNSIEFVDYIKKATPDTLQYLIKDMFETITFYDNSIESVSSKKLSNGKYEVTITFNVSKYRVNDQGKEIFEEGKNKVLTYQKDKKTIKSIPLNDYVEVGVFGEKTKNGKFELENELHNQKYKIDQINNKLVIVVDKLPIEVGVDPYNKLIDTDSNDNRKKI